MKSYVRLFAVVLFALSNHTFAAQSLASGTTIVSVGNAYSNNEVFSIKVSGGTGPCVNQWINFIGADAKTPDIYKRAYAVALLAFATGSTVNVYSDVTTNYACDGSYNSGHGTYLEIDK